MSGFGMGEAGRSSVVGALTLGILVGGAWLGVPGPLRAELYGVRSLELQDFVGSGLNGLPLTNDKFGHALAVGDFNCDGRDDLAIADYDSLTDELEGAVHVLYAGASGLDPASSEIWKDFDTATGSLDREALDRFGAALAAGNFDGNSFNGHDCDDLAIGIPGEDIGGTQNAGMVLVLYGFPGGLSSTSFPGGWRWRLGAGGIGGTPLQNDRLGDALAAGDFDNDGKDDLAIGIPGSQNSGAAFVTNTGNILVMYGGTNGLGTAEHRIFHQNSSGGDGTMLDSCEANDYFGASLAAGDFNQDLSDDLAVGVPGENGGAGAVQVLYGFTNTGLRLTGNQFWSEANVDTGGVEEAFDNFGFSLAAGDVTGEGTDDLVIGAPYEDVDGFQDAGAITLLWGQAGSGLGTVASTLYDQSDLGDGESPFVGDLFGFSLAIGDFVEANGVGANDLAIGVLGEDLPHPDTGSSVNGVGAVTVVPGGFGLEPQNASLWAMGYRGSAGASEFGAFRQYGFALAAGDFDGDSHGDLAVGAIGVNQIGPGAPQFFRVGATYVLYGALFADGFESEDASYWSASAP